MRGRSGLGIAFPLSSPMSRAFSRAIVELRETAGVVPAEKYGAVYKARLRAQTGRVQVDARARTRTHALATANRGLTERAVCRARRRTHASAHAP